MLVMDDNHRLPEWLAYHYFALPLRYLVVAVDPHSRTSPSHIFNQWRDRITIVEWTDDDFVRKTLLRQEKDNPRRKKDKHRARQNSFFKACAAHLQNHSRTWTTFHDTDEFLTISLEFVGQTNQFMKEPGSVLRMLQDLRQPRKNTKEWPYEHFQHSCISIPRALYSAVESTAEERTKDVPSFLDSTRFDTLRFRYRMTPRKNRDGLAKSIIDVSKLGPPQDWGSGGSAHKPIEGTCPTSVSLNYGKIPLGIHHYLGSWESYSFRDDARKGTLRNREVWEERSVKQDGGADDEIRPWIQGFVRLVGDEQAKYLLKDAGLSSNFTRSAEEEAAWRKREQ